MDLERALELLANGCADEVRQAYDVLCHDSRERLARYLRHCGVPERHLDDLLQDTFLKVWSARAQFRNEGLMRWRAYLKRVATNTYLDSLKGQVNLVEWDEAKVPVNERPIIDAFYLSMLTGRLLQCADQLWLGLDAAIPSDTRRRQLIAAQLHYLEGASIEEILGLLPCPPAGELPLSCELLRRWLNDESILCCLAFYTLYLSNDHLAACMLGYQAAEDVEWSRLYWEIGAMPPETEAVNGLNWAQVAVILWHFRNAMNVPKMLQMLDSLRKEGRLKSEWNLTHEHFSAVLVILIEYLPFKDKVKMLLAGLRRSRPSRSQVWLKDHALWERLVFQYEYHDDLPLKDIVERTCPAAQEIGFPLNEGTVNSWTSGGRLRKKLIRFWKQAYGGDFDE